jgi:hypothetical protein
MLRDKKRSGDLKHIINFLSFILLHALHTPIIPPCKFQTRPRELETHPSTPSKEFKKKIISNFTTECEVDAKR